MALSRLYFVTMDEAAVGHVEQVAAACAAGIRWIQLRMKEASDAEVLAAALAAKPICERYGCMLLVNDRVEVAIAAGVQGVHLGQLDMAVGEARRRLGEGKIIGGTANTMAQLREHWRRGADYIGLGPYRYTTTKKNLSAVLGLEGYRAILSGLRAEGVAIPVVAIGGIGAADVAPLLEAGLYGVAFSGMLVHADDPAALVRSLSNEIKMHEHAENCG
jgi:thiamine-phosphate pyrophosphorylase